MVGKAARVMRRGTLLLAGALLVGACSGSTAETTTTPTPTTSTTTPTTTTTSTTTTAPPATTPTTTTTTTTTLPLNTDPIEGVPDELVALIGAPMPEFDATIAANEDGTANVDDIKRWLSEWESWWVWLSANAPNATPELVAMGWVPGSDDYNANLAPTDDAVLNMPLDLAYKDDTSHLGNGFQTGRSLLITASPKLIHSFRVDLATGMLVSEEGPHTFQPTMLFRLLGEEVTGETVVWRVNLIEFPPS